MAKIAAALAEALRARGVADPDSRLAADAGIAVFRSDAPDLRIRLERAGRVVWDRGPQSSVAASPWLRPTEQDLDRAAAEAPGNGEPELVRSIVVMQLGGGTLPVAPFVSMLRASFVHGFRSGPPPRTNRSL